jgi:anti-anti-sigma factor
MTNPGLLEITERDGMVVASFLVAKCLSKENLTQLHAECGRLASGSHLTVMLDCSRVEYLGSGSLKSIFRMHKILNGRGGSLTLCRLPPAIAEIFQITKLDQILTVKESVEAARASLMAQHAEPLPACPFCNWPCVGACVICKTAFCEEHGYFARQLCRQHRWIGWLAVVLLLAGIVIFWIMRRL